MTSNDWGTSDKPPGSWPFPRFQLLHQELLVPGKMQVFWLCLTTLVFLILPGDYIKTCALRDIKTWSLAGNEWEIRKNKCILFFLQKFLLMKGRTFLIPSDLWNLRDEVKNGMNWGRKVTSLVDAQFLIKYIKPSTDVARLALRNSSGHLRHSYRSLGGWSHKATSDEKNLKSPPEAFVCFG